MLHTILVKLAEKEHIKPNMESAGQAVKPSVSCLGNINTYARHLRILTLLTSTLRDKKQIISMRQLVFPSLRSAVLNGHYSACINYPQYANLHCTFQCRLMW